ncbi:MAG: VWA domain-containing protein, partial [Chitinophagaceae bacterium]|nr:VWA domain-containing protein [Chitinophagaceae bacterium]
MKITNLKHWILLLLLLTIATITYSFINPKEQLQEIPPPIDEIQQRGSLQKRNITFSTSFENNYYTNKMREGYFYAEVRAGKYRNDHATESPLNISLVIDRSGSMRGDKIYNAKNAAKYIIDQLNENDYVSIVIYDDEIDVLQEATHPFNKRAIKQKIDAIKERASTNLMGGAEAGYRQVKRNYNDRYINRVLLLSDGMANAGITNPREINHIIRNHNNNDGITISTFGLGLDY